eukprot:965699_1
MSSIHHHFQPNHEQNKKDCWYFAKPSGCRYNQTECRFQHKIGKNSAIGFIAQELQGIAANQTAIYKLLSQQQTLLHKLISIPHHKLEQDNGIEMDMVPQKPSIISPRSKSKYVSNTRKTRSKRHNHNSSSDDDDNWMSSGAVSGTVNAQTTPQSTQNPSLSLPKQYPPKHHNTSVCEPARSPPKSTAITLPSECKDTHIAITVAQNKIKKQQQQQQPRPPKSPLSYSLPRQPRQPRQPRYPRQLPPNTKPIEHTNPQHPPPRSKTQCTAPKVQKSKRNTTKHPMQHPRKLPPKTKQIKKKKSQTKKTLNPYARVFSKGELYDTCNKDTKCKDDPPPKARPHTRQNTDDITPQSKPKPSQYLASIGLHIQPKQPKNLQRNMPPKSPQKKANPSNYSPPGHPKHSHPSHTQNTAKFIDKMGVFHGVPHHYPLESYLKNVQLLISNSTEDRISNIISHYARACKQDRILNQSHPMYFIEYVLNTTMKGKLTIKHVDILEIFEEKYPRSLLWITAVAPITTDTTFTDLMNELFHELDKENVEYNDIDNVISEKQHVKHDHHKFP